VTYLTASGQSVQKWGDSSGRRVFVSLVRAGFRRYSTYRQATIAGLFTNTVFGFLHCYVVLAVAAGAPLAADGSRTAAGYTGQQLATFVWVGQGLLTVVMLWGWSDLATRIKSGEIVADLLRPVHPVFSYYATDLGRAGFAVLTRFLPPIAVSAFVFDLYVPHRWSSYPLFVVSAFCAVTISFCCRYLVNSTAYWLDGDGRGPMMSWQLAGGLFSGLYFPLPFLPDWLVAVLWVATPFPSLLQAPLDVLLERGGTGHQLAIVAGQIAWLAVMWGACFYVQRRAEHRMVIQGG